MTPLLQTRNLNSSYGRIQALFNINLSVAQGEIIAIVGSNGAGKSTLLNTIAGVHRHNNSGSVLFQGSETIRHGAPALVKQGLVLVPERRQIWPEMTVADHLRLGAFLQPVDFIRRQQEFCLDLFPRLAERRTQLAGSLSGGEQQMLAIARALMARPKLLMLDEPSTGLAPKLVEKIFESVAELRQHGITVMIVEQMVAMTLQFSDRAYVIEKGKIVIEGASSELLNDSAVHASYLGKVAS